EIPLVRGRDFSQADTAVGPPVAIVNDTLARRLWADVDPIGQRVRDTGANQPWREVIGVVRDGKHLTLTESARGAYYVPARQQAGAQLSLVVRTAGDPRSMLSSLRSIARGL